MLPSVSLSAWEGSWRAVISGSVAGRAAHGLGSGFIERLRALLPTSLAARISPFAALLSLAALLFLSPMVGTGLNAGLVLLATACTAFYALANPPVEDRASALDVPILVLLAFLVIATAASPYPIASLKGLAKLAVYVLAYLVFRDAFSRGGTRAWIAIGALLLATFLECAYGLYQFKIHVPPLATWEDAESDLRLTRVYGTLRNPNLLGGYLVAAIPLGVAAALSWRGLGRWLGAGVALLGPLVVYLTYSRGAYVALAAELAVLALFAYAAGWKQKRTYLVAGFALLVVGVAGWWAWTHVPTLHARISSIATTHGDSSNSFRVNVWRGTFELVQDSWWFGVGIGNDAFRHAYSLYMVTGFEALGAYNIFLEWAAEAGIFAALAFCWLIFAALLRSAEAFGNGVSRPWAAACAAALVGLMVHGMVDTVFFRPAIQLPFWLILALVAGIRRLPKATSS